VTLRAEAGPNGEAVRMTVNGLRVGDPLTGNAWSETGYRWHDTLHLAHAACLGWSPVFRGLAGLKRRSDPQLDHVEDGGRAAVADEAIAWAVFCHARLRGWYAGRPPDSDLLDYVQEMTYALEVAARDRAEWAHAIHSGLAWPNRSKCPADVSCIHAMIPAASRPPVSVKHLEIPSSAPGPATMNCGSAAAVIEEYARSIAYW
jgi:hypothetical protein